MSNRNKKKKAKTTYYQSKSQTSKNLFHSPQAYGRLIEIPMTASMRAISAVSLLLQAALTVFAFYSLISLGFRFTCRVVPLEMWRLPKSVKQGMIRLKGQPLKLATLLVELETAVCFSYIAVILYLGSAPSNFVLLAWLAALILSIFFPCRAAAKKA